MTKKALIIFVLTAIMFSAVSCKNEESAKENADTEKTTAAATYGHRKNR